LVGFTCVQGEISFFSGEGVAGREGAGAFGVGTAGVAARPNCGRPPGIARGLDRFRQNQEQKPYHVGDGGVVVGRNLPRLAVEFGVDGYSDVSDSSHGLAFERRSKNSRYW